MVGVGLFCRLVVWNDDIVAIEDCELDLVGLPCRKENGAGDACEVGMMTGEALVKEGDAVAVGVGMGVVLAEVVGSAIDVETTGWLYVGCGPVYTCPSSPGVKASVEQYPSVEDIRRVRPSFDLQRD